MEISAAAIATKLILPRLVHAPISTVRSDTFHCTFAPRALVRRTRLIRRKSLDAGDDADDLFSCGGDDGPFGGGGDGSGNGGRGWNFGGDGGSYWEENKNNGSDSDPAFEFVYGVMSWLALSNCTHFAVKKLGRMLEERGKFVPAIC